jgi:hypothetical protein
VNAVITDSVLLKIGGAFALATLAAVLVPRAGDGDSEVPGLSTLLATGAVVGLLTTGALYLVLRRDLGLPATVALFAVGYNALVVLVKFVLGPRGLYEASQDAPLETWFDPSDQAAALMIAGGLFVAYAAVLTIVYRLCRRRLERRPLRVRRVVVITLVAAAVLFATGGLPLLLLLGGLDYAGYVLSSGVSFLVALALAAAVVLAAYAFRSTAEHAQLVGDVAVIVSVFWIGLAFLALYHALWVVYVLVLTSVWPLRVITPK